MSTEATCTLANGQQLTCTIAHANFASIGLVFFLFAIFCAYWAQTTGRNAWAWFFLGLFFAPITGLFLLRGNADDKTNPHNDRHETPAD